MIGGLFAGELTDGEAALRVYLAAGGLLLLGALLLTLTVRWWRGTRPEPPSLAPLEVMGERRWAKAPDADKQRLLEQYRPATADGTTPIIPPEPVDLAALAKVPPRDFGDLADDGARLGDDVRVVGPLDVGGVAPPAEADEVSRVESDGSADVDETVAIDAGDEAQQADEVDATSALIAPDIPDVADLDDVDDADDFERDVEAIDTGENGLVDEPGSDEPGSDERGSDVAVSDADDAVEAAGVTDDEASRAEESTDDTHDVVQQALSLDGNDLVEHSAAGD